MFKGVHFESVKFQGMMGIARAAWNWDMEIGKDNKFSTYAYRWVQSHVIGEVACQLGVPERFIHENGKVIRAEAYFLNSGIKPSIDQLAVNSGLSASQVEVVFSNRERYLGTQSFIQEDQDSDLVRVNKELGYKNDKSLDELVEESIALQEIWRDFNRCLTERQAKVLWLFLGFDNHGIGLGPQEIADLEGRGVTRQRIEQIKKDAIKKLSRQLDLKEKYKSFIADNIW